MARTYLARLLLLLAGLLPQAVQAHDWPMSRYDATRSAASPQQLPATLHVRWSRDYPPQTAAWPEQDKMQYDAAYDPIVVGKLLILNSSRHDCVRALDTDTGKLQWSFRAEGPIRFAPAAWQGKLYVASDDGFLYCLKTESGELLWKHRGGPNERTMLGNERLISSWPARGAPVVADGTVYFTASIWPFMGVFLHALDANTGKVVWINDGSGSLFIKQPHMTDAFASIAPQGHIVAIGNRLLLPGGRTVPACLDRATGKIVRYQLGESGKIGGGSEVVALDGLFFNGGAVFETETEKHLGDYGKLVVATPDRVYTTSANGSLRMLDIKKAGQVEEETTDAKGKVAKSKKWRIPELAKTKVANVDCLIKAGSRLYAAGDGFVQAVDIDLENNQLTKSWHMKIDGDVERLVAADDRLFVVTRAGRIYCFDGEPTGSPKHHSWAKPSTVVDGASKRRAEEFLRQTGVKAGYAVVWGLGDLGFLREWVEQSKLHVVVVEPDPEKVAAARRHFTALDLYGTRMAILTGTVETVVLPQHLASVMLWNDTDKLNDSTLAKAYQSLRPFGGRLCFFRTDEAEKILKRIDQPQAKVGGTRGLFDLVHVIREGAIPGTANWTHENGDASNTRVSRDQLVKAPLGMLWFGGPSNEGILPRHGHGPQPQVVDGRILIEGIDLMRALDIYTGRLLWETRLPGVGFFFNNLAHQPGANASGSNYVCTPDCIYVVLGRSCLRLDPETGKVMGEFQLPRMADMKETPLWGYVAVSGDYLIAGSDPLFDPKSLPKPPKTGETGDDDVKAKPAVKDKAKEKEPKIGKVLKAVKATTDNLSSSKHLVVMNRHTGKVLWSATANNGFRHNAICAGGDRVYAIDRLSGDQLARYKQDDKEPPFPARVVAFDLHTGDKVWDKDAEVFGTWLSYSEKRDILIEAGRVARDSLLDEPKGMRAYRAKDGATLWRDRDYVGPAMIHGDTVLQDQGGCDLLTGALKMRLDPITGDPVPWRWQRTYGCNTPAASEHLLTFRSGAAGYFDYCNDGGTGNFGGFRSSCTNNLIVAGGVLTAPDYTRTCTCAYQNQTSVGLIHMPEAEMWTFFGTKEVKGCVKRLGLNFGAAGDRRAEDGTLWMEYPSIAGVSPVVAVSTLPAKLETFRRHSSIVAGKHAWIASSGARGLQEITINLGKEEIMPHAYTVRLVFADPDFDQPGKRLFHVDIQGKRVATDLDVAGESGGAFRTVVKEFTGVSVRERLTIRLTPSATSPTREAILCGLEVVLEDRK